MNTSANNHGRSAVAPEDTATISAPPPLVTVIVTVYRRTRYLREALTSALEQTYPCYEILVTDDSHSPEIERICCSLASAKIRYRANTTHFGVALNVKAAIREAQGAYIAILNDDDRWEPEFLARLVPPMVKEPNRILAFSDHWVMTSDGRIDDSATEEIAARYGRSSLPEGSMDNLASLVLEHNGVPLAMASVFRKSALDLQQLVPEVVGAYDFWISCLLAATGRQAYYVPERLTRYRLHDNMETARTAPDKNDPLVFIYKKLLDMDLFPHYRPLLVQRLAAALYQTGKDRLIYGLGKQARRRFLQSLQISWNPRAAVGLLIGCLPRPIVFTLLGTKPHTDD